MTIDAGALQHRLTDALRGEFEVTGIPAAQAAHSPTA